MTSSSTPARSRQVPARRLMWDGQTIFLGVSILAALAAAAYLVVVNMSGGGRNNEEAAVAGPLTLADIPFNGERAYGYLKELCEFGARPSGSAAMAKQQEWLVNHFTKLGGQVSRQEFSVRHPQTGAATTLANIVVQWHPERKERLLLCTHYDTRPFPDNDPNPKRRQGIFVGANDGASGTALLCELAHDMKELETRYGVDFVLFDGEELVYDSERDPYFLGSLHFAREYVAHPPGYKYKWGVLLDMVGDAELQLPQERHGLQWRDTQPLVREIWSLAAQLKVKEFQARLGYEVRDDHLALHDIAKIPTIDIIDFDYPRPGPTRGYWHTEADTPDKCSALSLAKVGWVVREWLTRTK